ncbi:unnamed protein product [Penicillium pancosmium]
MNQREVGKTSITALSRNRHPNKMSFCRAAFYPLLGTDSRSDPITRDILRAVSLFVPPVTEFHGKPEHHRNIRPVSFEATYQSSTQESNNTLALTHISKGLREKGTERQPHLVLFFAHQTQNQSHIPDVIGALYAAAPKEKKEKEPDILGKPVSSELGLLGFGPPQLLFQLQPMPRIFRLKDADKFSSREMKKSRFQDVAAKYWIGHPQESEHGLEIDPTTNQVTFVLNQANQYQNMYDDVLHIDKQRELSGENPSDGIRESLTVSQAFIYRVDGGDEFDPWSSNKDGVIRRI